MSYDFSSLLAIFLRRSTNKTARATSATKARDPIREPAIAPAEVLWALDAVPSLDTMTTGGGGAVVELGEMQGALWQSESRVHHVQPKDSQPVAFTFNAEQSTRTVNDMIEQL